MSRSISETLINDLGQKIQLHAELNSTNTTFVVLKVDGADSNLSMLRKSEAVALTRMLIELHPEALPPDEED